MDAVGWFIVAFAGATAALFVLLALIVFIVGHHRPENRFLAALLFLEGVAHISSAIGKSFEGRAPHAFLFLFPVAASGIGILYIGFVSHVLPGPATRWLTTSWGRVATWASLPVFWTLSFGIDVTADYGITFYMFAIFLLLLAALFGLWRAVRGWRQAAPGAPKRRATSYLLAFAGRDLAFALGLGFGFATWSGGSTRVDDLVIIVGGLWFGVFLAMGTLRAQVLDLDFRIRLTISNGTVAAVLVATYFIFSQVAERFAESIGGWVGILAVAALLFALSPLRRLGAVVGARLMPDARPLELRSRNEHEALYSDQVSLALSDGQMSVTEMRMLEQVRRRLGLSDERAMQLQSDLLASL